MGMGKEERTRVATSALLEHLAVNPNLSTVQAARWLNNQRKAGEVLALPKSLINRIVLQSKVKATPAEPFNPPRVVVIRPQPLPPTPVPMEVTVPGTSETQTKFFTPGRDARKQYAETLALDNPSRGAEWVRQEVIKKFGVGLAADVIVDAIEVSRTLAGMKSRLRGPYQPKEPMPPPTPLVAPTPAPSPNDRLLGAAAHLKELLKQMGWSKMTLSIDQAGELDYDGTPLPVMPAKGKLKL